MKTENNGQCRVAMVIQCLANTAQVQALSTTNTHLSLYSSTGVSICASCVVAFSETMLPMTFSLPLLLPP